MKYLLPWTVDADEHGPVIRDSGGHVVVEFPLASMDGGSSSEPEGDPLDLETAEMIVRAVNCHADMVAACRGALTTFAILRLPRLDKTVASNEQLAETAARGLRAAITKVEG